MTAALTLAFSARPGAARRPRSGAPWPASGSSTTRSTPGALTSARFALAVSSAVWPALTELIAPFLPCCRRTRRRRARGRRRRGRGRGWRARPVAGSRGARRAVSRADRRACAAAGGPGPARRRARRPRRRRPWRCPAAALTATPAAWTLSASGIGERSGAPASGSAGLTGIGRATTGRRRDLAGLERDGAVAAGAAVRDEPVVEVLHRRLRVEREHRVLELVRAELGHDVRRDEHQRVADRDLAAPDVRLELARRQAALAVRVGQRREPGLADQVGLGGPDGRHVHLVAADDGHGHADRPVARRTTSGPSRSAWWASRLFAVAIAFWRQTRIPADSS